MMETYIYDGVEVKKTGRVAEKQAGAKKVQMIEITPVDENDGTWKKWVFPQSLFRIVS